jgi:hypothetical protein
VEGSRGVYYLNVLTESHFPEINTGDDLSKGHLVIDLPKAMSVPGWGRKGTTAENWPYRSGDLQIRVSPDKKRAFGRITTGAVQGVGVDVSGLTIAKDRVSGSVTAVLRPTYGGEKQENRSYTFTLDGTLSKGVLTGRWKSGDSSGELGGGIEVTAPMGDDLVLWALAYRGLNPGKPEKTNTLLIHFRDGVAQQDGLRVLHYKGIKTEGSCNAADVTLKDGRVSGTIEYGNFKVQVGGAVLGTHAMLRCVGDAPLAESYAVGRLWPEHPKLPDLVPLAH